MANDGPVVDPSQGVSFSIDNAPVVTDTVTVRGSMPVQERLLSVRSSQYEVAEKQLKRHWAGEIEGETDCYITS
jgi:hypothetical protein